MYVCMYVWHCVAAVYLDSRFLSRSKLRLKLKSKSWGKDKRRSMSSGIGTVLTEMKLGREGNKKGREWEGNGKF